jgi:uncharacterized phage protein (TIGR01671 family)
MWNELGKNMIYDIQTVFECLKQQICNDASQPNKSGWAIPYDHSKDGSVFMQCAGIKDMKDNEIWQGDIIQDEHFIYEVRFGDYKMDGFDHIGFHTFCLNHNDEIGPLGRVDNGTSNIIGNIYNNPELIK